MDPYEELGIPRDADAKAIKSAWRKLTGEHHPDRAVNDADRAARTAKMARINRAHEILNDKDARARFDATGTPDIDPKQASINMAISAMLTEIMNHPVDVETTDLLDQMRQVSQLRERSLHNTIVDLEKRIDRRKRVLRRLRRTDGGKNALAEAVSKQIAVAENDIAVARADIEFTLLVNKELENYSYDTGVGVFAALGYVAPKISDYVTRD